MTSYLPVSWVYCGYRQEVNWMKRYQMRMAMEGSKKYFYLWDDEALEIVPLHSK